MAIVKLKDVTVTRLNSKGFGVKVTESNEVGGKTYRQQFTLWFKEPHGLAEGDVVSVSGFLSAKVGEPWTDRDGNVRTSVELSLNSPRLDEGQIATGAATGGQWSDVNPSQGTNTHSTVTDRFSDGNGNWSTNDAEAPF